RQWRSNRRASLRAQCRARRHALPGHPRGKPRPALRTHRAAGKRPYRGRRNRPLHDPGMKEIALAWKMARRELRGGLKGFRIFFLCLLLGTAAIAAVESLSDAFLSGLRDSGQTLLGGDVAVTLVHRPATAQERAFLNRYGRLSSNVSMQSMAYALRDGKQAERQLVEI